jgi:hypothetical protein
MTEAKAPTAIERKAVGRGSPLGNILIGDKFGNETIYFSGQKEIEGAGTQHVMRTAEGPLTTQGDAIKTRRYYVKSDENGVVTRFEHVGNPELVGPGKDNYATLHGVILNGEVRRW